MISFTFFYSGVFTAVGIIYKEQGVKGFFCGLIPRLLCDITALWLGKTLAHIINNYLLEDRDLKQYVSASMNVSIHTSSVLSVCLSYGRFTSQLLAFEWYREMGRAASLVV